MARKTSAEASPLLSKTNILQKTWLSISLREGGIKKRLGAAASVLFVDAAFAVVLPPPSFAVFECMIAHSNQFTI